MTALFSKLSQVDSKVERVVPLVERVKKSEAAIRSHQNRLKLLEYKSIDIESRSRRRNLIFRGIREMPDESNDTCMSEVRRFLRVHLGIDRDMYMERAHRLGKLKLDVTRPIIVAFRDFQDTDSIMNNTRKLAGTLFSVNRDDPSEIVEARRALYPMYKDYRSQNKYNKVSIQYPAKLVVNGEVKHDMFPDWSTIMSGYRVDSRQLYVNNSVTRPQPIAVDSAGHDVSRGADRAVNRSADLSAGEDSRGHFVCTLTINETVWRDNTTSSTTAGSTDATSSGACGDSRDVLVPPGDERARGERRRDGDVGDSSGDSSGADPGGGSGRTTV